MEYQVHTALFEGPLDLLLHLIEKDELDITELSLAKVTDEFLAYVEALQEGVEMEVVADFLVIAARLLVIKSRVLLPRPQEEADAEGDDEDEDELIQQLRTYRRYKEAAGWLRERDEAALRAYVRVAPLPRPRNVNLDLSEVTLEQLGEVAQASIYPRDRPRPEEAVQRPRISIAQQITLIRKRLRQWQRVAFQSLLSREPTRVEAAVTLQAILELIKQRALDATQERPRRVDEPIVKSRRAPRHQALMRFVRRGVEEGQDQGPTASAGPRDALAVQGPTVEVGEDGVDQRVPGFHHDEVPQGVLRGRQGRARGEVEDQPHPQRCRAPIDESGE
jgi:segregation and condensation protein A